MSKHSVSARVLAAVIIVVLAVAVVRIGGTRRSHLIAKLAARPAPTTTGSPEVDAAAAAPSPTTVPAAPPIASAATEVALPTSRIPKGKGMWIYMPQYVEGGDPTAIVARARAAGLTHLYVRTGSSVDGFNGWPFLDALLPVAHAAGLRIIGWDFPYLDDPGADATRAIDTIFYVTPSGDRIDGFSADIETPAEGVALTPENAAAYGRHIRDMVGPDVTLIATVPRPTLARQATYPYAEVVDAFDAIAPMVYWLDAAPTDTVAQAIEYLSGFGKPVLPVGQAYDSSLEGGVPGTPTPQDIDAFITTANIYGASGVSFWSWQHATDDTWSVIASAPEVGIDPRPPMPPPIEGRPYWWLVKLATGLDFGR